MADAEREFSIKITGNSSSLVNAAKQSSDALSGTATAAQKHGDSLKDAGQAAEHSEASHRQLLRALRLISPEFAEIGHAAHLASLGPLALGLVTIAAMSKAIEHWTEKMKEARKQQAEFSASVWESQTKGAQESEQATKHFEDALKHVASALDTIKEKYADQKAILDATVEQHEKLFEAMEKEELAGAKDKDAKEAITKKYEALKRAGNIQAEEQHLQQGGAELQETERARDAAEDKARSATFRYTDALENKPSSVTLAETESKGKDLAALQEEAKKAGADRIPGLRELAKGDTELAYAAAGQLQKAEAAQKAVDDFKRNHEVMEAWNKHLESLKTESEKATESFSKLKEETDRLKSDLGKESQTLSIHKTTAFEQGHAGEAMGFLGDGEAAAKKFAAGGKLSKSEDELMRTIATLIAGQNESSKQAAAMLANAAKHPEIQNKFIEQLLRVMEKMGASLPNFSSRVQKLENDIERLQHQVRGAHNP